MKINHFSKTTAGVLALLLCVAMDSTAQQRGGGGFGGFGGFGGNNNNRGSSSSTSSSYNNNGTVGNAVISVNPDTHDIVVIADEETSQQISNVIANLDAPKSQVLIKVVFIEVQLNDDLDIGIEGAYVNNGLGSGVSGSAANVFGLAGANSVVTNFNGMGSSGTAALSPGTGGANGFYQIVGKDFQATLKAVAVAGKAQVLSRPSILARDGQLAKIVVGQEIYMPSGVSYVSSGTSTTTPIINGSYSDIGIILSVTPFIGANNLVEMILQPQTSTVDSSSSGQMIAAGGGLLGSSPVYAPNINIRSADTVVVTPDAQTVVIGGLISNSKSSSDNKVPLLGDIPLLGYLFKSSSTTKAKTELLMFLTPHIVQSPAQLMALVPAETHQAPAITNSVSEQELDRFLERVPVKKEPAKKTK
jgi:general secretion pathway protein D